jgi:hypothetical protein
VRHGIVTESGGIHSEGMAEVGSGRSSREGGEGPNGKGAASSQRDSMGDKRQKNQLQMLLAFSDEGRSDAPTTRRGGTESLTAKRACESPVIPEQVMEEVCGRENCLRALRRVQAAAKNQRGQGNGGVDNDRRRQTVVRAAR